MIRASFQKRDAIVALAVGAVIAFGVNIWFNVVSSPENIDDYLWLARLQEPGAVPAERLARSLYPALGYPWCIRLAIPVGYAILIVMWALIVLGVIEFGRITILVYRRRSRTSNDLRQ